MATRQQQEQLLLAALCYDQTHDYAYGEDLVGNSTEIEWGADEWCITDRQNGQTHQDWEQCGLEKTVQYLSDPILADMIERLGLEEEAAE